MYIYIGHCVFFTSILGMRVLYKYTWNILKKMSIPWAINQTLKNFKGLKLCKVCFITITDMS